MTSSDDHPVTQQTIQKVHPPVLSSLFPCCLTLRFSAVGIHSHHYANAPPATVTSDFWMNEGGRDLPLSSHTLSGWHLTALTTRFSLLNSRLASSIGLDLRDDL